MHGQRSLTLQTELVLTCSEKLRVKVRMRHKRWCRREELLKPLTRVQDDGQYLRTVLIGATLIVLIVVYTCLILQWSSKTARKSNSLVRLLESAGLIKPRVRKLL
jgi:hypothetical protein